MEKQGIVQKKFFKNNFLLSYTSSVVEKYYEKLIYDKFPISGIIINVLLVILQITGLVLNKYVYEIHLEEKKSDVLNIEKELIYSYILLIVVVSNFIIGLVSKIKGILVKISFCFTFFNFCIICNFLRIALFFWEHKTQDYFFRMEILLKCVYVLIFDNNFVCILISTVLQIVDLWINGYYIANMTSYEISVSSFFLILFVLFGYMVTKHIKMLFLYEWKLGTKNEWLRSTLDKLQNGLIVLDRETLHFCNDFVFKNLGFLLDKTGRKPSNIIPFSRGERRSSSLGRDDIQLFFNPKKKSKPSVILPKSEKASDKSVKTSSKLKNRSSLIRPNENKNINIYYDQMYISEKIFQDLEINPELNCDLIEMIQNKNSTFESILDCIQIDNNKYFTFNEFKYIGIKKCLEKDDGQICVLEMYLRIVQKDDNLETFEFIFNDVTRMKIIEEAKAQMKYKTLFLAKIAHEFKNPLIGISELIDEIVEHCGGVQNIQDPQISENLNLAKNLSAYMLLLVKDFEVISKQASSNKIEAKKSYMDIREEMAFLEQIIHTLISKTHGAVQCPLQFKLEIADDVPKIIYSDKIRLNQVLINLLSNSIKFTHQGLIKITMEMADDKKILVSVSDSGKGIPENQAKSLFKSFSKRDDMNNIYGSGLGLSIVKDLCALLGEGINYEHNKPKGARFYFTLDHIEESINAIKMIKQTDESSNDNHTLKNDSEVIENNNSITNKKIIIDFVDNENADTSNVKSNYLLRPIPLLRMLTKRPPNGCSFFDEVNAEQSIYNPNENSLRKPKISFVKPFYKLNEDSTIYDETSSFKKIESLQSHRRLTYMNSNNIYNNYSKAKTLTVYEKKPISEKQEIEYERRKSNYLNLVKSPLIGNININNFNTYKLSTLDKIMDNSFTRFFFLVETTFEFSYIPPQQEVVGFSNPLKKVTKLYPPTLNTQTDDFKKLFIIIADDESLVRKSEVRVLDKYFTSLQEKEKYEVSILEVADGVECIYAIYQAIIQQTHIDLIISDETMKYMSGSFSVEILIKLISNNLIPYTIPVFIVTAYENTMASHQALAPTLCGVYSKPMGFKTVEEILKAINK